MYSLERITGLFKNAPVFEFSPVSSSELPFDEVFRKYCERCEKYNACFSCPPFIEDFLTLKKRVLSYKNGVFFSVKSPLTDAFGLDDVWRDNRRLLLNLREQISDITCGDVLAAACSGCNICRDCSYPEKCRFPEKLILPLEAYCIDVFSLADAKGMKTNDGNKSIIFFMLLMFD